MRSIIILSFLALVASSFAGCIEEKANQSRSMDLPSHAQGQEIVLAITTEGFAACYINQCLCMCGCIMNAPYLAQCFTNGDCRCTKL